MAAAQGLKVASGAVVADVTSASPADDAGIRTGDVIVRLGTTTINTARDLTTAVGDHQPGDKVAVVVNRDGTEAHLPGHARDPPRQLRFTAGTASRYEHRTPDPR